MYIKAYTSYNEYNNTHYYTNFKVIDELPAIGSDYNSSIDYDTVVTDIKTVLLDCEQGFDSVYDYDYYNIIYNETDKDTNETEQNNEYVAILRECD